MWALDFSFGIFSFLSVRNKPKKAPKEQDLNPKWQPMQMADPGEKLVYLRLFRLWVLNQSDKIIPKDQIKL